MSWASYRDVEMICLLVARIARTSATARGKQPPTRVTHQRQAIFGCAPTRRLASMGLAATQTSGSYRITGSPGIYSPILATAYFEREHGIHDDVSHQAP